MNAFQEICHRESSLLHSRGELFARSFGLSLSLQITRVFLSIGINENVAMLLMWLVGIAGAFFIAVGGNWVALGFVCLFLHYILDYCDGQLARQHKSSCLVASVRDRWIHFTVQASAFVALGAYFWQAFNSPVHLLAPAACYIWFQFRLMIAHLPEEVYCGEYSGYSAQETDIIQINHQSTIEKEFQTDKFEGDESTSPEPKLRHELRNVLMNFDGFNFTMILVSLTAIAAAQFSLWTYSVSEVILFTVWGFVGLYAISVIDYTVTYLFSSRINRDIVEMENKIKGR